MSCEKRHVFPLTSYFFLGFQNRRYGSGFTSGEGIIDGKGRDASADSGVQTPHCFSPEECVSIRIVVEAIQKPSHCIGDLTQSKEALTVQVNLTESK